MPESPLLLTVFIETDGTLDKEGVTYRRLIGARLKWGKHFTLKTVPADLDTTTIRSLCQQADSDYVVFLSANHSVSGNYLSALMGLPS